MSTFERADALLHVLAVDGPVHGALALAVPVQPGRQTAVVAMPERRQAGRRAAIVRATYQEKDDCFVGPPAKTNVNNRVVVPGCEKTSPFEWRLMVTGGAMPSASAAWTSARTPKTTPGRRILSLYPPAVDQGSLNGRKWPSGK